MLRRPGLKPLTAGVVFRGLKASAPSLSADPSAALRDDRVRGATACAKQCFGGSKYALTGLLLHALQVGQDHMVAFHADEVVAAEDGQDAGHCFA
jgi:hypothetical protein